MRRSCRRTLCLWALLSVPMLLILWNTGAILLLLGQNATLAALAQDYIRVYMWSIPLFLTTLAFRNFLAALERPMWSLIVGVVGVLGNILFNYRSEEHTSELQSLMRISYAGFCLKKKNKYNRNVQV